MDVKYPNVDVLLTGQNGNAFNIIGLVQKALRRAHVPDEEVEAFRTEAMSGDYDHLIQTAMRWVNVS